MSGKYLVVTFIGVLPFALAACTDATSSSADPRMQPPLVRIETVEISGQSKRSFTGVVAARVQSDLGFRVSGKVLGRLVDAGQTVKRGQALVRIDPTDLRLALRAHEEAVAAARARARQTADDEARLRGLVAAGAVSPSAYDKARAAADAARAELNAAEARADVARNETGYAVLLADADGVVVETLAEPGQVVGAGQVAAAGQPIVAFEIVHARPEAQSTVELDLDDFHLQRRELFPRRVAEGRLRRTYGQGKEGRGESDRCEHGSSWIRGPSVTAVARCDASGSRSTRFLCSRLRPRAARRGGPRAQGRLDSPRAAEYNVPPAVLHVRFARMSMPQGALVLSLTLCLAPTAAAAKCNNRRVDLACQRADFCARVLRAAAGEDHRPPRSSDQ